MMFQNNFVTAVRVAGKILREDNGVVQIPFGSEYSLFLKNKHSVRALVRVEIDGVDATDGISLIIEPNQSIDLERFIKNGNMAAGLKFKFIERTAAIESGPRGISAEDGIVRIEFEFERPYTRPSWQPSRILKGFGGTADSFSDSFSDGFSNRGILDAHAFGTACSIGACAPQADVTASCAVPQNEVGITVGGSVSNQTFTEGAWFPTDGIKHVMCMSLRGQVGARKVEEAVTVKTRRECPSCGKLNQVQAKFCQDCGTGLVEV